MLVLTTKRTSGFCFNSTSSLLSDLNVPYSYIHFCQSCHQTRGYLQQSLVSASSIPASPDVPPARHGMPTNKSYNGDVTRGYGDLERIIATHNKSTKQVNR